MGQAELPTCPIRGAHLILALIVIGFGLRLAIAPFHSWLPDLAEDAAGPQEIDWYPERSWGGRVWVPAPWRWPRRQRRARRIGVHA